MSADMITAICALLVSVIATCTAVWSAALQRKYMRLSVRPIAAILQHDYEDQIAVYVLNKGLGPMLLKKFKAEKEGGVTYDTIIQHMPKLNGGIGWKNYRGEIDGCTLENGKCFELLVLEGNPDDHNFKKYRDEVRKNLSELTLTIEYEDLYGKSMPLYRDELSWFKRQKTDLVYKKYGYDTPIV